MCCLIGLYRSGGALFGGILPFEFVFGLDEFLVARGAVVQEVLLFGLLLADLFQGVIVGFGLGQRGSFGLFGTVSGDLLCGSGGRLGLFGALLIGLKIFLGDGWLLGVLGAKWDQRRRLQRIFLCFGRALLGRGKLLVDIFDGGFAAVDGRSCGLGLARRCVGRGWVFLCVGDDGAGARLLQGGDLIGVRALQVDGLDLLFVLG